MNSVELIKYMMLQYPYIYTSKMEVCNRLFMEVENGYEWKGGGIQPLEGLSNDLDFSKLVISAKKRIEECKQYSDIVKRQCLFIIDNIDLLVEAKHPFHSYRNFCGISEESLCMMVPDNITKDWCQILVWFMRYYKLFLNETKILSETRKGVVEINKRSYEEQMMLADMVIKNCQ